MGMPLVLAEDVVSTLDIGMPNDEVRGGPWSV
jgi:hypothetical protein